MEANLQETIRRHGLRGLPTPLRILITGFVIVIGAGYLVAVANIATRHEMADGKPGLSLNDIRAVYGGLKVAAVGEAPSRMLTMIRTQMREYFSSDTDFNVLESWLKAGAAESKMDEGEGRRTPRKVMVRDCLRCHAISTKTEISQQSPFGPDEFTVDYGRLSKLAAAPTTGPSDKLTPLPPQYSLPRLILFSHQHMLAIPVFTLLIGVLFYMTRFPTGSRVWLTPVPMAAAIFDFAGWWLARAGPVGGVLVAAAGAVFGLVFGLQIVVILVDLWRPGRRAD